MLNRLECNSRITVGNPLPFAHLGAARNIARDDKGAGKNRLVERCARLCIIVFRHFMHCAVKRRILRRIVLSE